MSEPHDGAEYAATHWWKPSPECSADCRPFLGSFYGGSSRELVRYFAIICAGRNVASFVEQSSKTGVLETPEKLEGAPGALIRELEIVEERRKYGNCMNDIPSMSGLAPTGWRESSAQNTLSSDSRSLSSSCTTNATDVV